MSIRRPINRIGNLDIDDHEVSYRADLNAFNGESVTVDNIEKALQRKNVELNEDKKYFHFPYKVQQFSNTIIHHYNNKDYVSYQYLRQLLFAYKLPYFVTMVEIAKLSNHTNILWDAKNLIFDEDSPGLLKAMLFETDEMKIFNNTSVVSGIKELILVAMTDLERLNGKPTRSNFFEQDDHVIKFAEEILRIENLDDLEHFLNQTLLEEQKKQDEIEKVEMENAKRSKGKKKGKKKKVEQKYISNIKSSKAKAKKKNNMLYIGGGIAVALGIFLNMGLNDNTGSKALDLEVEAAPSETDQEFNNSLLHAYRLAFSSEVESSIDMLDEIGYNNFDEIDRGIYIKLHRDMKDYETVITLAPEQAKEVVSELVAETNIDELKKLKENLKEPNPYVEFEYAYFNQDYETVIENKDKVDINGIREDQIFQSYIGVEDYDGAEDFAKEIGNSQLLSEVNMYKNDSFSE